MDIWTVLREFVLPGLYAFVACAGFCVIFNLRGKQLFFAPLGGTVGWITYLLTAGLRNETLQFFLAAVALAVYSEIMARVHRAPVTCYLLVALLPLVPGGGIYYTMEHCINGDTEAFLETGLHTLGLAGALALGVVVVSSVARLGLGSRLIRRLRVLREGVYRG
ncbi:MAG: threonine/serine exporter family protein [Candidatus Merdivicinus sp.]|jgi:uncharacterized membrane protein YjjB (DUF3815 family)